MKTKILSGYGKVLFSVFALLIIVLLSTKVPSKKSSQEFSLVPFVQEQSSQEVNITKPIVIRKFVSHSKDLRGAQRPNYALTEAELKERQSIQYIDKFGYGKNPLLTEKEISESPQLASVAKSLQNPEINGSRISSAIAPKAFDKDRYLTDEAYKKAYIRDVEPGRAFLTDSQSDSKLKRLSPYLQDVEQGDTVEISVSAIPGAPVSITSFDLGKFSNHLTYQTVEADSSGVATFTFHGIVGTIQDSNILVASPMSRNKLKFVVNTQISQEKLNTF